jgi:hypothetical protein
MERDIEFLSKVFALLNKENVFRPTANDRITDFRQPKDLQVSKRLLKMMKPNDF